VKALIATLALAVLRRLDEASTQVNTVSNEFSLEAP
jgi:hypothetical protein